MIRLIDIVMNMPIRNKNVYDAMDLMYAKLCVTPSQRIWRLRRSFNQKRTK